jgi:hypothetical protein
VSRPEPDPDLVLATFTPEEREMIGRWVSQLGLDSFTEVPPLRQLLPLLAVLSVAGDVQGGAVGDRIRTAGEALGLEDDPDRATHAADRYIRSLTNWNLAARRGKSFHASENDAA